MIISGSVITTANLARILKQHPKRETCKHCNKNVRHEPAIKGNIPPQNLPYAMFLPQASQAPRGQTTQPTHLYASFNRDASFGVPRSATPCHHSSATDVPCRAADLRAADFRSALPARCPALLRTFHGLKDGIDALLRELLILRHALGQLRRGLFRRPKLQGPVSRTELLGD